MSAGPATSPGFPQADLLVACLVFTAVLLWPGRSGPGGRPALLSRPAHGWPAAASRSDASQPALTSELVMDLVVCGLRAGLPVVEALACAARAAGNGYLAAVVGGLQLGVPAVEAWAAPPPNYGGLARAMVLAELSGAPAAAVVSRAAADVRLARRERAELAAARLGVRLVLPLGLMILPGFVLLAVAPIVLGLASSLLQST
jgi:Type II secretion system (T2SS), protein F